MIKLKVDVAVIGAGTAGLNAFRAAEKAGVKVLLIGKPPYGTTCARVGCMPSKLLIAASDAAHHAKNADRFGIETSLKINGPAVLRRVQKKRDWFVSFVNEYIHGLIQRKKLIEGQAKLISPHLLEVNGKAIHAKAIVFATGVSPRIPKEYHDFKDITLTNESIFEMKQLPKSLLVVGTGVIGLELGSAFQRLGVKTTILGRKNKIGPLSDPAVLKTARSVFVKQIDIHAKHRLKKIKRSKSGAELTFIGRDGKERKKVFERILIAAGRRPNLDFERLKKFGVPFLENGYPSVNKRTGRAGKTHFFFAGDVAGVRPILHEATFEGRMAGVNAAGRGKIKNFKRLTPLTIIFTDPQIALVGRKWNQLDLSRAVVGSVDYGRQGRSQIMEINQGRVNLYADSRSGKFLGAEMFGPRVEHMAHLLTWAIEKKMKVKDMLSMPFYHPSIEEGIQTALENLQSEIMKKQKISLAAQV